MVAESLAFAAIGPNDLDPGAGWTAGLSVVALVGLAWLLTYALHSTLLLGSAWVATRRMPTARAGLRERLWKFAVLGAFATASLQVGLGFEPLGGRLPLRRVSSQAEAPRSEHASFAAQDPAPADPSNWPVVLVKEVFATLTDESRSAPQAVGTETATGLAALEPQTLPTEPAAPRSGLELPGPAATLGPWLSNDVGWTQWIFATCLLGALGGLLLFALLWVRLKGCLRDRVALEHGPLADKLRELCARAGLLRRVRLSVAPALGAPISMGMFRPEICVPPRVLLELSAEEQEVLLAHELAHVVRRDPMWLALCRLCEGVFFFQPLNRVARREIEDCAEFLSDAWAVRQTGLRFSLASCLTRIAEWIVGERRALPAPAMAQGRSRLRHRVELLLDESSDKDVDRRPAWLGAACLAFGASLIAIVPCVSATEELLEIGDHGGLPFLPDRGAGSNTDAETCNAEVPPETTADAGEPAPAELAEQRFPDSFAELKLELDLLAAEIALLRGEAATLDLCSELAGEVAGELELLEMKLSHVRELALRLDVFREALASSTAAPLSPARDPHDATALIVQPRNPVTTSPAIFEELTK